MTQTDSLGLRLSGADADAAAHFDAALRQLQCYRGDPVAEVEAALRLRPDFTMAHCMKAWLHLLGTEPEALPVARAAHQTAAALPATARERGHIAAISHLVEGRWHAAGRVLEDVTVDAPHDALALLAGHQIDFFTGQSRMLRDRIARAMPAWDAAMPGFHSVLGMRAFGLEETGHYAAAEAAGRHAVELMPVDGWAQHAVAHVMEMQARQDEGIAWMRANPEAWSSDSFMAVHNWWHLALYHLELGEIEAVLALFDDQIYGARSAVVIDMVDASALLWRLKLRNVDVGDRWQALAANWSPVATAGNYAFNDAHAVMAFVGAGRFDDAEAVLAAQKEAMARPGDNAAFTSEVGHDVARALIAFGRGDYASAVAFLRAVRPIASRFGGSHAQRDVLDLTLIEAAFRAGQTGLARALVHERAALRPESPLSRLFVKRADLPKAA